jgi:hypothetical protein
MMKKAIRIAIILGFLLTTFIAAPPAFATDEEPHKGPYSTLMLEAFAAETGKTVDEIKALRESGLTYREIALQLGYEGEELSDLFDRVGEAVLALAVEEGIITQEVSDQLSQRLEIIRNIASWLVGIFLQRLGLTREEVVAYLQSGMTLREIMEMQGIEVGQGLYRRCGLSMEEIISRVRAGESMNDICPPLVNRPDVGTWFEWPGFDWSGFELSGYQWPWLNQP